MTYNELTRRHFETAAHAGLLTGPGTRRGAAGSRAQGTWVQFDLLIGAVQVCATPVMGANRQLAGLSNQIESSSDSRDTLCAVRFQAFGCPHVIAVADWVAQQSEGSEARPALPESVAALALRFAVPTEKLGRLLLIEDAWIAALAPPSLP